MEIDMVTDTDTDTDNDIETNYNESSGDVQDHHPHHDSIHKKLDYFLSTNKIPNIIFHGPAGTGKKTIVYKFLNKIYGDDKLSIKSNIMTVNCSHGKGIKFIREDLKFFSKMNIQYSSGVSFKSIILFNADCLTIDAQSALRRCIELFSHNTRFFIVVENKHKLLNPIISRFCEIYVPELLYSSFPNSSQSFINLHKSEIEKTMDHLDETTRRIKIDKLWDKMTFITNNVNKIIVNKQNNNSTDSTSDDDINLPIIISETCNYFYENGISALDILALIKLPSFCHINKLKKVDIELFFHKVKGNFRNEKLIMFYLLWKIYNPYTDEELPINFDISNITNNDIYKYASLSNK